MEWLERMNGAIGYMEDNIMEEIEFEKVAQIAGCSVYHFQRMFSFITDVPISEYIRRRRLTLAAFELQNSDIKVLDLALKYGYDSHESFSRAFVKLHGLTPSLARNKGATLKAFPRISFHISIKGDTEMNYKIENKAALSLFGVERIISTIQGSNFITIPEFWQEACKDGTVDKISEDSKRCYQPGDVGIMPVNAVMCYRETGKDTFPYMLCGFMPEGGVPEHYTKLEVPALQYAIFTCDMEHIQDTWKRIFSEWFPTSGYEHDMGPEFEFYGKDEKAEYCEVWIPVIKK